MARIPAVKIVPLMLALLCASLLCFRYHLARALVVLTACGTTASSLALTLLLDGFSWSVYLDPILALIFIAYVGLSFLPVLANDLNDLLDKTLREDLQLRIDRRLAEHFNDYTAFHGVRSRRAGGRIFIDLALSFDPDTPTASTLDTVRQLREKLERDPLRPRHLVTEIGVGYRLICVD